MPDIWTIGHWNHPQDRFIELLDQSEIELLVDVRSSPGSRRTPHFNHEQLPDWVGRDYVWLRGLGGRRRAQGVNPNLNAGWENASFSNYADYTTTVEFRTALAKLESIAEHTPAAYMCGEPVPWRCHRSIISDALVVRGWSVHHIMVNGIRDHQLGAWGATPKVRGHRVTYPAT